MVFLIGGGTRNRTRVRFPKRIAIEPASVRVFGLMSFFPRERYQLKSGADWVGERGSSRQVETEFDSAFRNRTGVHIESPAGQTSNPTHLVSFRIDTLVDFAPRIGLFPFTLFYPALISYPHDSRRKTMVRPIESAMTVRDVAKFLNVGNITVYRLVQAGELPGFKVAGSWRFQKRI